MSLLFDSIQKPTLLLDEATARSNIQAMAAKATSAGVAFRPHFKTHQSIEIGEWFRQVGLSAITVSSLDMAEYFAGAGWQDITLAFSLNPRQIGGINALARRIVLGVLIESEDVLPRVREVLTAPLDVWIKIDAGAGRTGLAWDRPADVLAVARAIQQTQRLRLRGLLTHSGDSYTAHTPAEAAGRCLAGIERLNSLRDNLHGQGIGPLLISIGDTPGCSALNNFSPADEIRPGNFVFYDAQQLNAGACQWEAIAVALACPVVALHPERGEAVVYGGAIHLSKDILEADGVRKYGLVCLPENGRWGKPLAGAYVSRLSQEHGVLHLEASDLARLSLGDLVCILPAHSCLTAQAMGIYLTLEGRRIEMMRA